MPGSSTATQFTEARGIAKYLGAAYLQNAIRANSLPGDIGLTAR
jgi:hypothetical protein